MSLLLLFNPSPGINQLPLTPVAMQDIESLVPRMVSIDKVTGQVISSASLRMVMDASPSISYIERATGEFTDSNVEYSSSTVTYSSTQHTYGGQDQPRPVLADMDSIDQQRPILYKITKR